MRKTKDYGYVNIGVPEELLEEFRSTAASTGKKITDIARAYFENMIEINMKFEQPIDVSVSVNDFDLERLKWLAARSNMNVKKYIQAYYNASIMKPKQA